MSAPPKSYQELFAENTLLKQRVQELEMPQALTQWVEHDIYEKDDLYRTALEHINDGVAIVKDGKYIYVNQKALDNLGRNREEVINNDFGSFVQPDDRAAVMDYYRKSLGGQATANHFEVSLVLPDRGTCYVDFSLVAVNYKGNKALLLYARNITDRKKAEDERNVLISDLKKALEEIKTLKGIVPICSKCKNVRDDEGYWEQVESYISRHTEAKFSHGICPDCLRELYPYLNAGRQTE